MATNGAQHDDENRADEGTEDREEEEADTERPSKRAKVVAVLGKRNTAK